MTKLVAIVITFLCKVLAGNEGQRYYIIFHSSFFIFQITKFSAEICNFSFCVDLGKNLSVSFVLCVLIFLIYNVDKWIFYNIFEHERINFPFKKIYVDNRSNNTSVTNECPFYNSLAYMYIIYCNLLIYTHDRQRLMKIFRIKCAKKYVSVWNTNTQYLP